MSHGMARIRLGRLGRVLVTLRWALRNESIFLEAGRGSNSAAATLDSKRVMPSWDKMSNAVVFIVSIAQDTTNN